MIQKIEMQIQENEEKMRKNAEEKMRQMDEIDHHQCQQHDQ